MNYCWITRFKKTVRSLLKHQAMHFKIFYVPQNDEPPEWFQQQAKTVHYMSAAQVHSQLKEKAKQR